MDMPQVVNELHLRIEQSRQWLEADADPLRGLKFRTEKLWTATPITFLDDAKRVERYGIGFVFGLDDPDRVVKAQLNVRIKPDLTPNAETNETPYIVIYAVDQSSGADVTIKWFHIGVPSSYAPLSELSVQDWYRHWLSRALTEGKSGKILGREMRLSE